MQKTILITGATSGIGKAAAMALAKQGHQIILHGRNQQKAALVRNEIIAASGNEKVSVVIADLYLLSEIRNLCALIHNNFSSLDILINNAGGLMGKEIELTQEGYEKTFAINVLAPFMITKLLMDMLVKSSDARIINVSSNSHQLNAHPDFDDLQLVKHYNPLRAYGNAKLFLIWNTQHLVEKFQKEGIKNVNAYTLHPGAVASGFGVGSNLGPLLNIVSKIARPFFRTPEAGADGIVFLATAKTIPGKAGDYFVDKNPVNKSLKYYTPEREKLIWDYCLKCTNDKKI